MNRLVCFHLFNDFSGSPKVLRMVLGRLAAKDVRIDLVTSKGEGALSGLAQQNSVRMSLYAYRFSNHGIVTMLRYTWVQIYLFLFSFRYLFNQQTVFYINTILPVGAALAGRMMRKRVVYHYHENAFAKGFFYKSLAWLMQRLASEIICVSEYQRAFLKRNAGVYVVPNSLPFTFVVQLKPNPIDAFERKSILMLGSLKQYKGTYEFIKLAIQLRNYAFELVLNETEENISKYWKKNNIVLPNNLKVYPQQDNVISFYNRASLVLNLTNKNLAIETFGMTALEAMSAGLPVIVPSVGGIAEMVEDGVNGYKIDVQDLPKIAEKIDEIFSNRELYEQLSSHALTTSKKYNADSMIDRIGEILGL